MHRGSSKPAYGGWAQQQPSWMMPMGGKVSQGFKVGGKNCGQEHGPPLADKVYVVFSNHLDVGYTDNNNGSCAGAVTNRYWHDQIDSEMHTLQSFGRAAHLASTQLTPQAPATLQPLSIGRSGPQRRQSGQWSVMGACEAKPMRSDRLDYYCWRRRRISS